MRDEDGVDLLGKGGGAENSQAQTLGQGVDLLSFAGPVPADKSTSVGKKVDVLQIFDGADNDDNAFQAGVEPSFRTRLAARLAVPGTSVASEP